jgi:hypothetical protein
MKHVDSQQIRAAQRLLAANREALEQFQRRPRPRGVGDIVVFGFLRPSVVIGWLLVREEQDDGGYFAVPIDAATELLGEKDLAISRRAATGVVTPCAARTGLGCRLSKADVEWGYLLGTVDDFDLERIRGVLSRLSLGLLALANNGECDDWDARDEWIDEIESARPDLEKWRVRIPVRFAAPRGGGKLLEFPKRDSTSRPRLAAKDSDFGGVRNRLPFVAIMGIAKIPNDDERAHGKDLPPLLWKLQALSSDIDLPSSRTRESVLPSIFLASAGAARMFLAQCEEAGLPEVWWTPTLGLPLRLDWNRGSDAKDSDWRRVDSSGVEARKRRTAPQSTPDGGRDDSHFISDPISNFTAGRLLLCEAGSGRWFEVDLSLDSADE